MNMSQKIRMVDQKKETLVAPEILTKSSSVFGQFEYAYTVGYSDIDIFKHMSYVNYIKVIFNALDSILLIGAEKKDFELMKFSIEKTQIQFMSSAVFGDQLLISVIAKNITASGFELEYSYFNKSNGLMVCRIWGSV